MFPRTFRQPKNDAYSVNSNVSKTMGKHFVKVGGEFRAYQFFRFDEVNSNGIFAFSNEFTRRDPLSNTGAASGNGLATFLLGLPTSGNVVTGTPRTEQYRYYALYLQDDWKIGSRADAQRRPALGLSAGGHREGRPDGLGASTSTSTNPLQSQLPQGAATINPATGQPMILNGGLIFANRGGPESPYKNDWNNSSRASASPTASTTGSVSRANYGRSYLGLSSGGQNGVYTTDFQRTTPFIATAPNGVDPGTPWANPFPDGFLLPLAGELGLLTALGTDPPGSRIADYEIPYTDQWMAGVDIQLPWNIGLDVAYVGNQVSKLGVTRNQNLVPAVRERQGDPDARRQHRLPERDVPESVRGARARARASTPRRSRAASCCGRIRTSPGLSMNRINTRLRRTTTRSRPSRPSATATA